MIREIRPPARSTYGGMPLCSSGNHTRTSLLACSNTLQECHCCVYSSVVVLHYLSGRDMNVCETLKIQVYSLPSKDLSDFSS